MSSKSLPKIASTERIAQYEPEVREVLNILFDIDTDRVLLTDESTLSDLDPLFVDMNSPLDFNQEVAPEAFEEQVKEFSFRHFGVAARPDMTFLELAYKISQSRQLQAQ